MTDNYIQLNKNDVLRLGIKDSEGNPTGEYLEFDLEDIELPIRYQDLLEQEKKNMERLRNTTLIIDKRQDVKGKKLLSKNEEDEIRATIDFFKKETEIYNMFLGENGVQKLLNGRKFNWGTLGEINQIIDKQILPHIDFKIENIADKVAKKYSQLIDKSKELKVDE